METILEKENLKDWKIVISSGGLLCQHSTKTIFLTSKDDFGGFLHELAHAKVGIREEWDKTGHDVIWGDELTNLVRKYTKPLIEEYRYVKTVCGLCGKDINNKNWEYNDITLNAKIGKLYPEVDCRTEYQMDSCADCFENKILPELKKLGNVSEFNSDDCELEKMQKLLD